MNIHISGECIWTWDEGEMGDRSCTYIGPQKHKHRKRKKILYFGAACLDTRIISSVIMLI